MFPFMQKKKKKLEGEYSYIMNDIDSTACKSEKYQQQH